MFSWASQTVDLNQWLAVEKGPNARKSAKNATTTPKVRRISRRSFHVMPTAIIAGDASSYFIRKKSRGGLVILR